MRVEHGATDHTEPTGLNVLDEGPHVSNGLLAEKPASKGPYTPVQTTRAEVRDTPWHDPYSPEDIFDVMNAPQGYYRDHVQNCSCAQVSMVQLEVSTARNGVCVTAASSKKALYRDTMLQL